jgi:hypothetical protein
MTLSNIELFILAIILLVGIYILFRMVSMAIFKSYEQIIMKRRCIVCPYYNRYLKEEEENEKEEKRKKQELGQK